MSIFGIDGTDTWLGGALVRRRNGRYSDSRSDDPADPTEGLRAEQRYDCAHKELRGARRCLGCGRTLNEIALDGDA